VQWVQSEEGFLPRKKKIQAGRERWLNQFDWSIDPQTSKEIISLLSFALALVYILGVFGGAGRVGEQVIMLANTLFGIGSFLVPIAFIGIGLGFGRAREIHIKGPALIGFVLLFVFVPALFFSNGGSIGVAVSTFFSNLLGTLAAFFALAALMLACALLSTNISLKQFKVWLFGEQKEEETQEDAQVTKVSVFQNVRNKLASRQAAAPTNSVAVATHSPTPIARSIDGNWLFPPLDLLPLSSVKATPGNITKNVETIQKTLKDFGVNVAMGDVHIGPTVTQYTFKPSEGVKLTTITARANDLALALAAHPIRIEAPIPGKAAVGVEVPNKTAAIVTLREILESESYRGIRSNLKIALGRDVAGVAFSADLKKMPHLLIAGATGSGKSVAINSIIMALLYQNSPADLRIILIDPKRVEFTMYNGIPHLLTGVVTEVDKTINTLRWAVAEMERRYKVFASSHKRNVDEYNAEPSEGHMPYLVVIIDELADLMAQAANEAEAAIVRLAQMARATGIHLIVATQRPSVDVITGLIKANIPTRVAFAVASQVDSRTIIDQAGADKLLGNGDMLYLSSELGKPKRVQGVLIGEKEIKAVTDFLKKQATAHYEDTIQEYHPAGSGRQSADGVVDDDLYNDAKEVVVAAGKGSASLLQRRLRVGYARAARLLDLLEQEGIIGPPEGSKPRDVLMTPDMLSSHNPLTPVSGGMQAPSYFQPFNNTNNADAPSLRDTVASETPDDASEGTYVYNTDKGKVDEVPVEGDDDL